MALTSEPAGESPDQAADVPMTVLKNPKASSTESIEHCTTSCSRPAKGRFLPQRARAHATRSEELARLRLPPRSSNISSSSSNND